MQHFITQVIHVLLFFPFRDMVWDAATTLASLLEILLETYLKVCIILKHNCILLESFVIPGIQNLGDNLTMVT